MQYGENKTWSFHNPIKVVVVVVVGDVCVCETERDEGKYSFLSAVRSVDR